MDGGRHVFWRASRSADKRRPSACARLGVSSSFARLGGAAACARLRASLIAPTMSVLSPRSSMAVALRKRPSGTCATLLHVARAPDRGCSRQLEGATDWPERTPEAAIASSVKRGQARRAPRSGRDGNAAPRASVGAARASCGAPPLRVERRSTAPADGLVARRGAAVTAAASSAARRASAASRLRVWSRVAPLVTISSPSRVRRDASRASARAFGVVGERRRVAQVEADHGLRRDLVDVLSARTAGAHVAERELRRRDHDPRRSRAGRRAPSVAPRALDARADQRLHRVAEPVDAQVEHREQALDEARRVGVVPELVLVGIDPHRALEVAGEPLQPGDARRRRGVVRVDAAVRLEQLRRDASRRRRRSATFQRSSRRRRRSPVGTASARVRRARE